jgi:hypothetical protein
MYWSHGFDRQHGFNRYNGSDWYHRLYGVSR